MKKLKRKTVLFLCTGNYFRSRFAEILFNSLAARLGSPWRATSRALALERGVNNVGPMARVALDGLIARGIRAPDDTGRLPLAVAQADFDGADWVVALKHEEHLPLFQERFPALLERVEFWEVDDAPEVLDLIEREVLDLAARLISGRKRGDKPPEVAQPAPPPEKPPAAKFWPIVKIGRETKGRGGKGVTLVYDVPLDDAGLTQLAQTLKQRCGTGGTVKDGRIEIQGDQRERLAAELEKLGYRVKRAGG